MPGHANARRTSFLLTAALAMAVGLCSGCRPGVSVTAPHTEEAEPTLAEQAARVRAGKSEQLRLDRTLVRDADLSVLDGLDPGPRRVNFSRTEITDAGLARLCALANLEQLRIASPQVTDAGLAAIGRLKKLRFLHLLDMPITDEGLAHLHALKQLESLYLDRTQVTDEGHARLLEALPGVHLHIDDHHHRLDPQAAEHEH